MKFMRLKLILLCLPAMLLCMGCKILPGHDPVVVNAERTTQIALATFDFFLKFEYENKELLASIDPGIHVFAEQIRRNGKTWLESARNLTKSYKRSRTEENKFSLTTALAVLEAAVAESHKYVKLSATIQ